MHFYCISITEGNNGEFISFYLCINFCIWCPPQLFVLFTNWDQLGPASNMVAICMCFSQHSSHTTSLLHHSVLWRSPSPPLHTPSCDWSELHPLLRTGWNSVVWFGPSHFLISLYTQPGLCTNTRFFSFSADTRWTAHGP